MLFDLGSAQASGDNKARQVTSISVIGHTDKLGDKALNEQLARARSTGRRRRAGQCRIPAKDIVIAADPEAFGRSRAGQSRCPAKDRKVTILFRVNALSSRSPPCRRPCDRSARERHRPRVPSGNGARCAAHDAERRQARQFVGIILAELGATGAAVSPARTPRIESPWISHGCDLILLGPPDVKPTTSSRAP